MQPAPRVPWRCLVWGRWLGLVCFGLGTEPYPGLWSTRCGHRLKRRAQGSVLPRVVVVSPNARHCDGAVGEGPLVFVHFIPAVVVALGPRVAHVVFAER